MNQSRPPPRFKQLTMEQLDAATQTLAQGIMRISRSGIGGPYNVMLRSPRMAERLKHLLDYLRFESSLPPRLSEWAILIQARVWSCQLMWRSHAPLAVSQGLDAKVAHQLGLGRRPSGMQPDEEVVYDFCMELAAHHEVSDAVFERARELLGEQSLVDLMAISGTYVTVGMFLNVAQAQVPDGEEIPLQRLSTDGVCHVH